MERHPDSASSPGFPADPTQAQTALRRNWLHRLVNFAVAIVVLAVAAGTFFLSYPGVHAIARQGGVSGQLARFYPALFDAVLVIACVAAVMLRDARWWARCWAWVVAIVMLGAIGVTDVLHAMNYGLRQRPTEGVVAAAPVVAVLLAFSLFLTMLRQSRPQAPAQAPADDHAAERPTAPMMFSAVDIVPGLAAGSVPRPPAPPIALPAAAVEPSAAGLPGGSLDQAPDAPAAVTQSPETAPTQEIPALAADASEAGQDDGSATGQEPALSDAADEAPEPTHPPTEQSEGVEPQAQPSAVALEPTPEATPDPSAGTSEHATDEAPDETGDEAADEAGLHPAQAPPTAPQAIRYASSAAAEQFASEDWEAEVDPALAGQVYPVLTSDPDIEVPPHQPGQSKDLEDDAPPFATAPFASVPRLNRVRVTPTPPTEDADAE
jgi:Protein of unknown function (DUF2637)